MLRRTSDSTFSTTQFAAEPNPLFTRRTQFSIPVAELERLVEEFLLDCQLRQLIGPTVGGYRNQFLHLCWFLEQRGMVSCGTSELKQFLHYLQEPPGAGGR